MAKVLIAEDNRLMRWSLETSLTRDGHVVHSVESGEEAIDALRHDDYRVVLTDYQLPKLDGLHVLWHVKTKSPQTHVIVITGNATPTLERLARDMGAFEFLEKPVHFVALKEALDFALVTPAAGKVREVAAGCASGRSPVNAGPHWRPQRYISRTIGHKRHKEHKLFTRGEHSARNAYSLNLRISNGGHRS